MGHKSWNDNSRSRSDGGLASSVRFVPVARRLAPKTPPGLFSSRSPRLTRIKTFLGWSKLTLDSDPYTLPPSIVSPKEAKCVPTASSPKTVTSHEGESIHSHRVHSRPDGPDGNSKSKGKPDEGFGTPAQRSGGTGAVNITDIDGASLYRTLHVLSSDQEENRMADGNGDGQQTPEGQVEMNVTENVCTGFADLVAEIAIEHNVELSSTDRELLESLEGIDKFRRGEGTEQFESHGICVEVPKGMKLPFENQEPPTTVAKIEYGPNRRLVYIHPEKLTPLGLSVLSWVCLPGRCEKPFRSIVNKVQFRNCFVQEMTGREGTGEPKKVVIPLGWPYVLKITDQFIYEHGDYGDMAVRLGMPISSSATPPSRVRDSRRCGLRTCQVCGISPSTILRQVREPTRIRRGYEFLYLDADNCLVYDVAPENIWEWTGLNLGATMAGFGLSTGGSWQRRADSQASLLRREASIPVRFPSMSRYVSFAMTGSPHRGIMGRMHWLEECLEENSVFPKGTNRGFLMATTGDCYLYGLEDIFFDKDCRIRRFEVQKTHRVEQDVYEWSKGGVAGQNVYIWDRADGVEKVYRIACQPRDVDQWQVVGGLEQADKPTGTIPLCRDLC